MGTIKRINKIKNMGVFSEYHQNGDIRNFEEKNIIHGWNYSGKTTLSRLISYLDKDTAFFTFYIIGACYTVQRIDTENSRCY